MHATSNSEPIAPLIRSRLWRFINLFTYLLYYTLVSSFTQFYYRHIS